MDTNTTPSVQYSYSEMAGGANHSRLTGLTYPNGRQISYNYASGLDDSISRLSSITDGFVTLESYEYLGLGTVVDRAHPQPGVDLTYVKRSLEANGDAGDPYTGIDRFGRVVDQRWTTSDGTAKDRRQYGYDRDSNRLYMDNLVDSSRSELYTYDGLNQLTSFQRGTLNGTKDGLVGAASRSQDWNYDALGNFDSQTTDGITQTRSANRQNEITSISGATTPTYDANGNQTMDEARRTFTYDAWNHPTEVRDSGTNLLATYRYDGLGRRVRDTRGSTSTEFYYSAAWQVLEERANGVVQSSYAWSPVYVDAMIARDRDTNADGTLDERLYPVQDANFNVVKLLNASGAVVEQYQEDAYGQPTIYDPNFTLLSSSAYGFNYLHQGLRWDGATGKFWNRRRDYDPMQGRFIENDPKGFGAGDANFLRYESNRPNSNLDALGLDSDNNKKPGGIPRSGVKIRDAGLYPIPEPSLVFIHAESGRGDQFWAGMTVAHSSRVFVDVRSWDDVLANLKSRKRDPNHLYKSLVLSGHGGGGGCCLSNGGESIGGSSLEEIKKTDPKKFAVIKCTIDRLLTNDAPVIILSCGQATDGGTGALAKLLERQGERTKLA